MTRRSWLDRIALVVAGGHARRTLSRFVYDAQHAEVTQQRVLLEKVGRNAASEFGRAHGLEAVRTFADLAARVPISAYDDYAPYVERMKRGEARALLGSGQRVMMFALTSGTTREPKYVPVTPAFLAEYRRGWNAWGLRALADHPGCLLRTIVQVSSPMDEFRTEAGIPCGAITGLMAATQKRLVRRYYAAPLAVASIRDAAARYYTLMRLALPCDVAFMVAANPATMLLLARTAADHAERLIRDIRDGTLCAEFPIDEPCRAALRRHLRPDAQAARRLEGLVERHGVLRPRDCWDLGFIAHWTGGTMGLYRGRFPEWFGDVPVRDPGLLASEGRMSLPVEDDTAAGILDVGSHFFEFIDADEYEAADRRALTIREVEVGREYFVLLTTSSGFWRYDIGDRIRVVGRFGQAPVIEFLSKGAHTCSLTGEKLSEHQAVAAMREAAGRVGWAIERFLLAPRWAETPHYRLYVERLPTGAAAALAGELDRALSGANIEYASKRSTQRLGGIDVRELAAGTLAGVDRRLRARNAGRSEQFKPPFLLTRPGEDEELLAGAGETSAAGGAARRSASAVGG